MNRLVVIVDADAIVAQAYSNDSNHNLAVGISKTLAALHALIIYPASAIQEATTVLQGRLNRGSIAYGTAAALTDSSVQIAEINQTTLKNAMKYFNPVTSKKNTFFDCTVAAIAEEYQADAIFSFDRFYKKKGFKLAEELK